MARTTSVCASWIQLYQTDRAAWAKVAEQVVADHGITRRGATVDLTTDVMGLTVKQWDWLRDCILEAARDETIDPEA